MKLSLYLSSITLLFFLTSKSSANPKTVTEEILHRACPKTKNYDMCRTIMMNHMGQPLFQSLARVSAMAHDQAKSTGKQIWDLYKGIKDNKSELKLRLHNCWQEYSTAANRLMEANEFLQIGIKKSVKNRVLLGLSAGISGDRELARHKQYLASSVIWGSRKFRDLCNILIVLCDEL